MSQQTSTQRSNQTGSNQTRSNQTDSDKSSATQKAQETVEQTKQDIQSAAHELSAQAQQKAGEVKEQVQQKATEVTEEARRKASSTANEQMERTAGRLDNVADSLRRSGREFHTHDEDQLGEYVERAASQIESISAYLHDRNVSQLLEDARGFARKQPELFMVGALAAGFLTGRFFKSSGHTDGYGRTYPSRRAMIRDSYPQSSGQFDRQTPYYGQPTSNRSPSERMRAVGTQYSDLPEESEGMPYSRTSHQIPVDRPPIPVEPGARESSATPEHTRKADGNSSQREQEE